ncbi:MAG: exodeoxyribonuclease VII large subunit [Exilispira sp.]
MRESEKQSIYSVKEITLKIKTQLESDEFSNISISGEVSNYSTSQSGHLFFNLKEVNQETSEQYILKAVIWKYIAKNLKNPIQDGDKVICKGRISLYPPSGEYRFVVDSIKLSGEGEFFKKFLELKEKLFKEGLFDPEKKKHIPEYPATVGIITSESGAALQDILNTIKSRAKHIDIIVFPVLVQGEMAAKMICLAIKYANQKFKNIIDVLILARGGGSIEDLWPFNEEIVARTIFDSDIPIISGIGHETDYTIADFVADYRAPTPTGAATIVSQGAINAIEFISKSKLRLTNNIKRIFNFNFERVFTNNFRKRASLILHSKLDNYNMRVDFIFSKLSNIFNTIYLNSKQRLVTSTKLLENLSPEKILSKGYSITRKADGNVIIDANNILKDEEIETILYRGKILSRVEKKIL